MNRGDILDLGNLGKTVGKAAAEGDIDKVLALLDKADKLLNNPLIQGFLGMKSKPYQVPVTAPAVIEKVPDGAIIPASDVHAKIMRMMNRMDSDQLMGLLSQYGGENATQAIEKES